MLPTLATAAGDLFEKWDALSKEDRVAVFQALPHEEADDFFLHLGTIQQAELILLLPAGQRRIWMRLLAPDDAADLLQDVAEGDRSELLATLDDATRREVVSL